MVRFILGLWMLAAGAGFALAEEASPGPSDTLEVQIPEVVVTALRGQDHLRDIPAPTFVVSGPALARSGVTRVSSLIGLLPGFYGYGQRGSGETGVVDPRGFTANGESSYLKLLVNGQDVRDVENGAVDWDWITPEEVDRVEVVQGAGAWLYGDGSEGGIVNIVRRQPRSGLNSAGYFRGGSYGLAAGTVVLSSEGERGSGLVRGTLKDLEGFRDRSSERVGGLGGDVSWKLGVNDRVSVDALYLDADRDDPGALTRPQILADRNQAQTTTDFENRKRVLVGAHWKHAAGSNVEWTVSPYARFEDSEQVRTLLFTPLSHPTNADTWGAELAARGASKMSERDLRWSAGASGEGSTLESDYFDPGASPRIAGSESRRQTLSGWANGSTAFGATTLRAGLRGDIQQLSSQDVVAGTSTGRRTLSSLSPFVSLAQTLGPHSVYASFSTAFRAPTMNQLYDSRPFSDGFGGFFTISNSNLDPQRSTSFEVGGRAHGPAGGEIALALYSIHVKDEIDFDLATFRYANIGKSWHRGIQLAMDQPLRNGFAARVGGTWSPTTIEDGPDDGNQINAVPEGTAYGSLIWSSGSVALETGVNYAGRQFLDKANTFALGDFMTMDAGGSMRVGGARATLRVANLLDRKYEDSGFVDEIGDPRFYPAAGRRWSFAIGYDPKP
jgi:outer membrane receptor protein involved in Fe transport